MRVIPVLADTGRPPLDHSAAIGRISSLLVKPVSALCNLDCEYCFYVDRATDPYRSMASRTMSRATVQRLIDGYLAYSFPQSTFVFQGGEPTLAGLPFFQHVVALQRRFRRDGHVIGNSIQTNGLLLDSAWCDFFNESAFLVGLSLDGPEEVHDRFRTNKARSGSWRQVMNGLRHLQSFGVDLAVLCVVSQANVARARATYAFFRELGLTNLQFIPVAEFAPDGTPLPSTIDADEYGAFLCELFDAWWPEHDHIRVRFFDNIAEAIAGQTPGCCTLHDSCDSYAVVEYNGDVYPCDFFVEGDWRLGNIESDTWPDIARRHRRVNFAATKRQPHAECETCEYRHICHGGCPQLRRAQSGRFTDLDWFCGAYKQIFSRAVPQLTVEVAQLTRARRAGGGAAD